MPLWRTAPDAEPYDLPLGQYRWNPLPLPKRRTDFIDGMHTMTSTGDARQHSGMATNIYAINEGMADRVLLNADAEMMIVPEFGKIVLFTEMG